MRALILDDEYTAVEYLETLLERHCPEITEVAATTSVQEALSRLKEEDIDVFFTDIEMDEMSGLDLVFSIDPSLLPPVIFTTAYNQYAIEAFRVNAVHYLLKPIDPKELKESIQRVLEGGSQMDEAQYGSLQKQLQQPLSDSFMIPDGTDYHLVKCADVIRAEGSGSYTTFHLTGDRKHSASRGLKHFTNFLRTEDGFIRCHQSHLVNVRRVVRYAKADGGQLFLEEGHRVPVSHRLKSDVQKALGLRV